MTHFSKKTIASILFTALLSACGGQGTTDTASNTAQKAAQTTQAIQTTSTSSSPSGLLASLAAAYPNGQIPAASAAQAAKELAQNPAALHLTAATMQNAKSALVAVQPQAVAADYKAVTRIQNTTLTGAYFFTIYDTEQAAALAGNPNWRLEGPAFWASLASGTGLNSVHRFRNNLNGSYLYTIYEAEKSEIETNYASTFTYEGVAWYAQQTPGAGWSPLYRFRNLLNGTYLFSAYEAEKDVIVANYSTVFELEGVAYYVRQDAPSIFALVSNGNGSYYDKTECVQDSRTGLIWQGQTPPGTGLRAKSQFKTNYDNILLQQKQPPATYPTQADINAITNSIGFKNAVNATNLCGSSAWRLPTEAELTGIIKLNPTAADIPFAIDSTWFVNVLDTQLPTAYYWTSTPYTDPRVFSDSARVINFLRGDSIGGTRYFISPYEVRLVH